MLVLGIETSCDETGLALVRDGVLLDAVLASQAEIHALFGGVVPELASREHLRFLGPLLDILLARSSLKPGDLDAVAVARGPGLLGCLLTGVSFAKGLCLGTGAKLVGVNHLTAHLLVCGLARELLFPALGLLVSGGHTSLYRLESPVRILPLGRTLDDAAGEAFDKGGKILGLPYPAGRLMDRLARRGRADPRLFPRPYLDNDNLDFSFSGLKTALALRVRERFPQGNPVSGSPEEASQELCDCCASFNLAVVETLLAKVRRALDRMPDIRVLMAAGGVAANSLLRGRLAGLMAGRHGELLMPDPAHCTDNAAMIAYAGWLLAARGFTHDLSLEAVPRGRAVPEDWSRSAAP